jgi:energy-converting hydrogenase Eha subunit G
MWGFAWMFWLMPFMLFVMLTRRWRRERWAMAGGGVSPRLERELDEHRVYVDGLERRVAELEERLDFTERLLAQRSESVS